MSSQEKSDAESLKEVVAGDSAGVVTLGEEGLLLEALEAFGWLSRVLSALKGEALRPEERACDRLTGFGGLAQVLSGAPWRARFEAAMVGGVAGVEEVWAEASSSSVEVSRCGAVLIRGWGWDAVSRGEWARGLGWLGEGLRVWEELAISGRLSEVMVGVVEVEGGVEGLDEVSEALLESLVAEHVEAALVAMDAHQWRAALSHWRLVNESVVGQRAWGRKQREALVGRWLFHASALEHAGASRGVGAGDLSAARLVGDGLSLEPLSRPLHERQLGLVARLGGVRHALGDREGLVEAVSLASSSLAWCDAQVDVCGGAVLSERLAQVSVLAALVSDHPGVSLVHLRRAHRVWPSHPTVRGLLGQALAALGARLMGAGRAGDARRVVIKASRMMRATPGLMKLMRALKVSPHMGGEDL